MKNHRIIKVVLLVLLLAAGVTGYAALAQSDSDAQVIRIEVAEDGNRFVFDDSHLYEDGMPDYGTSFVTFGYIYPEGTLNGSNGVLPDGSPEFPDKVLGTWICKGWLIGEGMHTETGPVVTSTQIYNFGEEYGNATIVTDGFELADLNVPVKRAVTGGTGEYSLARGEMTQALLGFTDAMGVNLSVQIAIAN
ncbi:MAG TPA: hypothetical protein VKY59_02885 [Spirillospora sp.]|nr:hypothetical protein [Spirillospora sp.]